MAVLLLPAASCADSERKPAEMASAPTPLTSQAQNCEMRVAVQSGPAALLVFYEFHNRSGKTAFLFNLLHRSGPSGGPEADVNLVYAQQSGDSVVLSKKIFPVPSNVDVERPDVPYVSRVEPGQVFREKFSVPLPLKLWTPYPGPTAPALPQASVSFELGFFLAPDPSVAKQSGGHLVVYPFPAEKQVVLRSGPLGRFPLSADRN